MAKARTKLKIKKSVSRRFKVTKTGKVMHRKQNQSHLKMKKTRRNIRRGKEPAFLTGAFAKKIKLLLGEV